jgi:hypothetical protein
MELSDELFAVHTWHEQVRNNTLNGFPVLAVNLKRLNAVLSRQDFVLQTQYGNEQVADVRFIVHNQNGRRECHRNGGATQANFGARQPSNLDGKGYFRVRLALLSKVEVNKNTYLAFTCPPINDPANIKPPEEKKRMPCGIIAA